MEKKNEAFSSNHFWNANSKFKLMVSIRVFLFSHLEKDKGALCHSRKLIVLFTSSECNLITYIIMRVFVFPETYCPGPHSDNAHTQSRLIIWCPFMIIFFKYLDNTYKKEGLSLSSTLPTAPATHQTHAPTHVQDSTADPGTERFRESLGQLPFPALP